MTRCTCEQARREARAEAFREAAGWCERMGYGTAALHLDRLAAKDAPTAQRAGAGSPVGLSQVSAATLSQNAVQPAAGGLYRYGSAGQQFYREEWATHGRECPTSYPFEDITDCIEDDGFTTVHVTGWRGEDGGLDG